MKVQIVGCSHHSTSVKLREQLAFSPVQTKEALAALRSKFPESESVLLSTCNRVELYTAAQEPSACPTRHDLVHFIADFHGLDPIQLFDELFDRSGEDAIRHLFTVAASLDSMVVGEAQILSQVKKAYEVATAADNTGPLTHAAFQRAIRVAKRVSNETAIQQKRVSIPSVAVADFAKGIFERFDDKKVLVIGAGEMGEETLRYLIGEGARNIVIVNRNRERAEQLAELISSSTIGDPQVDDWSNMMTQLEHADMVVSTTGATEPIVTVESFAPIVQRRHQKPLFVLDLAVPRDFAPEIAEQVGVYLYCIDDLQVACDANRRAREREWPLAERIIEEETSGFMKELNHRSTGPTIRRLKQRADEIKSDELGRLWNKLANLDPKTRKEVERSFDRLVNKLLHPPLESLRDEAEQGTPQGLIDALVRLFKLKD
ncbi:MAG: glutamyl-tRNA reductase [Pirellulaceae bacterium]|jgi:glutamyl-tRNA reductase